MKGTWSHHRFLSAGTSTACPAVWRLLVRKPERTTNGQAWRLRRPISPSVLVRGDAVLSLDAARWLASAGDDIALRVSAEERAGDWLICEQLRLAASPALCARRLAENRARPRASDSRRQGCRRGHRQPTAPPAGETCAHRRSPFSCHQYPRPPSRCCGLHRRQGALVVLAAVQRSRPTVANAGGGVTVSPC